MSSAGSQEEGVLYIRKSLSLGALKTCLNSDTSFNKTTPANSVTPYEPMGGIFIQTITSKLGERRVYFIYSLLGYSLSLGERRQKLENQICLLFHTALLLTMECTSQPQYKRIPRA